MESVSRFSLGVLILLVCGVMAGCGGTAATSREPGSSRTPTPNTAQLTVQVSGKGAISSSPAGISCPGNCAATFDMGTAVTLSASAASGYQFSGYSGGCSGSICQVVVSTDQSVTAIFSSANSAHNLQNSINHIVFMLQENRSFDHYLGHLPEYWQAHTHQFPQATNGTTFDAEPDDASNVAADGSTVTAFHLTTVCLENPSPSWTESHLDWNLHNPYSGTFLGDGFVHTASLQKNVSGSLAKTIYYDSLGKRAMGYYTDRELNYYYFMASAFGTSDRWFSPVMSRTQANRMYLIAATSHGHAYEPESPLSDKTIFQLLDEHGISWKIYTTDTSPSYLNMFKYYSAPGVKSKIVPVKPNYFNDLANGSLPQVAMIEGGYSSGLDDHPTGDDTSPGSNIQAGSAYVSSLINALMKSSSWKNSVFILSYDEGGGFYDHVAPVPMPSPDGIPPSDLRASPSPDICLNQTGPTCDFVYTGYRVPLIVVSPFTKNYVSHFPADYTAILKLIETRFNLPSLTARDAHQMDMTEFFDFDNAPWANPPTPPAQSKSSPCYVTSLP